MERLTERGEDGKYFVRISGDNDLILGAEQRLLPGLEKWTGWWEHTVLGNIVDRLAAYEDTGLIPEEAQQMRWIPVEERLPEKQGEYIVFADGKVTTDMYIVCDEIERWLHYDGSLNEFYIDPYSSKPTREPPYPKVTHWMPLPQPPKEASHD